MKLKKLSQFMFIIMMVILIISCTTSASFQRTTEGHHIESEMDSQILEKSIQLSLLKYGWMVTSNEKDLISAKYSKSGDLIIANIEILYDSKGYSISYVDSKNLDYNAKRMTIHRNYNRWIANLNKSIAEFYLLESP